MSYTIDDVQINNMILSQQQATDIVVYATNATNFLFSYTLSAGVWTQRELFPFPSTLSLMSLRLQQDETLIYALLKNTTSNLYQVDIGDIANPTPALLISHPMTLNEPTNSYFMALFPQQDQYVYITDNTVGFRVYNRTVVPGLQPTGQLILKISYIYESRLTSNVLYASLGIYGLSVLVTSRNYTKWKENS